MPAIEIDESELQHLRSQVALGANYEKVFRALNSNPEAKQLLQAGIKKVSPNTPIPEFDNRAIVHGVAKQLDEKVSAATKELRDYIEGQKKEKVEGELTGRVERGREYLRSRGYQKEAVEDVEKLMQSRGIADYEAAEALHRQINPPSPMAMPGAQTNIDFINEIGSTAEEDRKLLFKGSNATVGDAFVKLKVPQILAELRGQTRAA